MPKTCGSVVDFSLVLFSIFGLFALHQEFFIFFLNSFLFLEGGGGGREGVVKSVPLWTECDDGESRFFIGTVCVCSSHDSLLLSGGICLDVI